MSVYSSVDDMMADGAGEVKFAEVEGPKEGKMIRICSVSAGDIIEWTEASENPEAKKLASLRLISKSLVDADGKRISSEADIPKLRSMRHEVTERIIKAILNLNGMTLKATEAAKNE